MKRITISNSERDLVDVSPSWIREHVQALSSRSMPVCVRVMIKSGSLNLAFATPACGGTRSSDREPNPDEKRLLELWRRKGLNETDFDVGQLIAFVNEVKGA
jgi:hypothetical protein